MILTILLFAVLLLAAVIDIWKREIPDTVHVLLLLIGFGKIFCEQEPWPGRVIGFFLVGTAALAVSMFASLGGGDIKLCACLTFALGPLPALLALTAAFFLAAVFMLFFQLLRKKPKRLLPFAPFLAVSCAAAFTLFQLMPVNIIL